MPPHPLPRPVVLLGPTAGGKSDLAAAIAQGVSGGGEILGADSMQIYRHLDAGTAKPPRTLRQRVPHHLIDIVEPTQRFTVHDWLQQAEPLLADVQRRGRTPVVVGGTNLYIKALLEGLFDGPGIDKAFRASLENMDGAALHARLAAVDPTAADRISPNDRKRLTRALEVFHLTGRPISELQRQWRADTEAAPYRHDPILIGLDWPAHAINPRINQRVKMMFEPEAFGRPDTESLPDETFRLERAGLLGPQAREALGYKQVLEHASDLETAFEQTKIQTRRFARQQRTWLKRFRGVHWLEAHALSRDAMAEEALRLIERKSPT